MPAQAAWLSPEQIHVLAAYVLSLSAGGSDLTVQPAPTR